MGTPLTSDLRLQRQARGLSQARLAEQAGITRQSYAAIESGASVPGADVAIGLARALGATVEELFTLRSEAPADIEAAWGGPALKGPTAVRVARVAGKLAAYSPGGAGGAMAAPADGVARQARRGVVRVTPLPERPPPVDLVAFGCDPAFELLAGRLRRGRGLEVLGVQCGSKAALEALARGEAHVAGVHLHDPASDDYNAPWIERMVPFPCTRVVFSVWEQGLLVRSGNPLGIAEVADLARPGLVFVNREAGSGSRTLVETSLSALGVDTDAILGFAKTAARGHVAVAHVVGSGAADAGVAIRAAGTPLGLGFVPLAHERYELVIPSHFLDLPAVQALLGELRHPALKSQVEALGGYDAAQMGLPL